jgi:hypothetical protein
MANNYFTLDGRSHTVDVPAYMPTIRAIHPADGGV